MNRNFLIKIVGSIVVVDDLIRQGQQIIVFCLSRGISYTHNLIDGILPSAAVGKRLGRASGCGLVYHLQGCTDAGDRVRTLIRHCIAVFQYGFIVGQVAQATAIKSVGIACRALIHFIVHQAAVLELRAPVAPVVCASQTGIGKGSEGQGGLKVVRMGLYDAFGGKNPIPEQFIPLVGINERAVRHAQSGSPLEVKVRRVQKVRQRISTRFAQRIVGHRFRCGKQHGAVRTFDRRGTAAQTQSRGLRRGFSTVNKAHSIASVNISAPRQIAYQTRSGRSGQIGGSVGTINVQPAAPAHQTARRTCALYQG